MENLNEAGKKFIEKKKAMQIIKMHLALKKIKKEKSWGNEYIKLMYKVDPERFENQYNLLDPQIRKECEEELKVQIENGEIDLYSYIVENYKQQRKKEIRRSENSGEGR